jgi:hypothetical protein
VGRRPARTRFRSVSHELVAPLVILSWADLMLGAQLADRAPLEASSTISAFCSGFYLRRFLAVLPLPDSHAMLA